MSYTSAALRARHNVDYAQFLQYLDETFGDSVFTLSEIETELSPEHIRKLMARYIADGVVDRRGKVRKLGNYLEKHKMFHKYYVNSYMVTASGHRIAGNLREVDDDKTQ